MEKVKLATLISDITSAFLWFFGLGVLVFNLLGMWIPWNLTGFGYYFYYPVPLIASCVALVISAKEKEVSTRKKYLLCNSIVLGISILMDVLTFTVFSTWFW